MGAISFQPGDVLSRGKPGRPPAPAKRTQFIMCEDCKRLVPEGEIGGTIQGRPWCNRCLQPEHFGSDRSVVIHPDGRREGFHLPGSIR